MVQRDLGPWTPAAIGERVGRLHSSLDPAALWPGVTRGQLNAAFLGIAAVTGQALRGEPADLVLPDGSPSDPHVVGIAAFISGTGPLLGYWIEQGLVRAQPEVAAILRTHREHAVLRHQMLARQLGDVLRALTDRGVTPTVLKGMHTAWQYFPHPGTRTIADIDLLVSPGELTEVARALDTTGLMEISRRARPFRSEWARPSPAMIHSLELDHALNPWTVDLHVALERRYGRGVGASLGPAGMAAVQPVTIDGHSTRGLAQPWLAAFLAVHCSFGLEALQLGRLVELVLVIRRDLASGALSHRELLALLTRTQTTRFAYPALELTEHLMPGTVDEALLAAARSAAGARSRRVVAAIMEHGGYRLPRRSLDDKLMWASGPRELLLALSELAWPSHSPLIQALETQRRRVAGITRGWFRRRATEAVPPPSSPPTEPAQQRHAADQP